MRSKPGIKREIVARTLDVEHILVKLVAKTLEVGAAEFEVQHRNGAEHVLAIRGVLGVGIARLSSTGQEAQSLRETLHQIKTKQRSVVVDGAEYVVKARLHDRFGENAFQVAIKRNPGKIGK